MPKKRWQDAFFDPTRGPFLYVLGAYILGISINLVSGYAADLAKSYWGVKWFFLIGGPVAIVAISSSFLSRRSPTIALDRKPQPSRGLVVIASRGDGTATARKAIEYHRPERLWVLHSDTSKQDYEDGLRTWALDHRYLAESQIVAIPLSDEQFVNPEVVQAEIERVVYDRLPDDWDEADVIIDMTGGRKQTTAGAFLAGLPRGRRLQVNIPKTVDPKDARGTEPGDPVEIAVDYKLKKVRRR